MMNYFIFDGESSLNYGVYIGGQNTFNAPQRDVAKVAIPGRNGDLIQDNGRFLNVQVPYNIVVMDEFKDKTDAIKAWLLSKKGYCKLVDTYHPGTYRMARVAGGIDFETAAYNLTGKTQVIFDCKPERFLDSGDDVFQVGVWGQTKSASGDLVTFEGNEYEAFRSIAASISPTQDLHGYDYPWPPGGGKNKFQTTAVTKEESGVKWTVNADGSITVSGTASAYSSIIVGEAIVAGFSNITISCDVSYTNNVVWDFIRLYDSNNQLLDTIYSGGNVSTHSVDVSQYSDAYKITAGLKRNSNTTISGTYHIQVVSGNTAGTWVPYSNICPISGRTGAVVSVTGKNLFDINSLAGNGITVSNGIASGNAVSFYNKFEKNGGYVFKPLVNGQYALSVLARTDGNYTKEGNGLVFAFTYTDGTRDYSYIANSCDDWTKAELISNPNKIVDRVNISYSTAGANVWQLKDFQIELSSSVTSYANFGNTYPISWQSEAGTVYGGTVDVVSGVLTVNRAMLTFNGGESESWGVWTSRNAYYVRTGLSGGDPQMMVSNQFKYVNSNVKPKVGEFLANLDLVDELWVWNGNISFKFDENADNLAGFKAYIAENPIQVLYKLATPQTYQLTGQQISTLLGLNNVWADIGSVDVEWSINPHIVRNPTRFASKPKMRVKGSGNGTVTVENGTITISNLNEYVDIDSELMNCYKGTANKNADVALPYHEYPELKPGGNYIDFSGGITEVEVKGRWWTI